MIFEKFLGSHQKITLFLMSGIFSFTILGTCTPHQAFAVGNEQNTPFRITPPLVIVHADQYFDPQQITHKELQNKIETFLKLNSNIYFLQPEALPKIGRTPLYRLNKNLLQKHKHQIKNIESRNGGFSNNSKFLKALIQNAIESRHLYVAGGYLELCLNQTVEEIVEEINTTPSSLVHHSTPITVHLLSKAVFTDPRFFQTLTTSLIVPSALQNEMTLDKAIELFFLGQKKKFIQAFLLHPLLAPHLFYNVAPVNTKIRWVVD